MRPYGRIFRFDGGLELGLQLVAIWPAPDSPGRAIDDEATADCVQLEVGFLVWRVIVGVEFPR